MTRTKRHFSPGREMTSERQRSRRALPFAKAHIAAFALCAAGCAGSLEPEEAATETMPVTMNPGSTTTVTQEANEWGHSQSQVVYVQASGACTGTIVAPYTVVTASHCGTSNPFMYTAGRWFQAVSVNVNPYTNVAGPYVPDWWIAANDAQKAQPGGRQDDWPAQHDQAVFFVPELTPAFLADNGLLPMAVDPDFSGNQHLLVGVASTGLSTRNMAPTTFLPATAGAISGKTRDGYLTRDCVTTNFACTDGGDSGGPSLGQYWATWTDGSRYLVAQALEGTTQNGRSDPVAPVPAATDMAPLTYHGGIDMTANQLLTAKLNTLWLKARMDDADGDGLPTSCDPNPGSSAWVGSTCPAELGVPRGAATTTVPVAQLQCKIGYAPVGMKGRAGWLVDQLQLKCSPIRCIKTGLGCAESYYTDSFGGAGGAAFEDTCPSGQVLAGFEGAEDASAITTLTGLCASYTALAAGSPTYTRLATHGGAYPGAAFSQNCGNTGMVDALQLRTTDKRFITGMQATCISTTSYSNYAGSGGGGAASLQCPPGNVAIGTYQRALDGGLNLFGLICANRQRVTQSWPPTQMPGMTVAHTGFYYPGFGVIGVAAVEPYETVHLPPDSTAAWCPVGYALNAVHVYSNSFINRVDGIGCVSIAGSTPSTVFVPVRVGGATGGYSTLRCPSQTPIKAFYARSGWLTDYLLMQCE